MSRHAQPRSALGRPVKSIDGILPGGTEHQLLLALRGPGGMTSEQISARFGYVSASLGRLRNKGLIHMPSIGKKGVPVHITPRGRELTEAGGPLSRSHLITYCQL